MQWIHSAKLTVGVVLSANGRIKPDLVLVNGKQECHKEGAYYLEWRDGSKRVRLSVGKDAQDAAARRLRKEAELNATVPLFPYGEQMTKDDKLHRWMRAKARPIDRCFDLGSSKDFPA